MDVSDLDKLAHLPEQIREAIPSLVVDRHGLDSDAYMVTEDIIQAVHPNQPYRLGWNNLEPAEGVKETQMPQSVEPPHARLRATWTDDKNNREASVGNIFRGFGRLLIDTPELEVQIPIAPALPSMLAFYNARLVAVGDVVLLDTDRELAVTVTRVGETYVDGFLMQKQYGGGAFLEYHDLPHLHMPLEPQAHGYLVLGNRSEANGELRLTAFVIPYGQAVLMARNTIHADSYLVGKYMIIYSGTKDVSAVLLQNRSSDLINLVFKWG